MDAEQCSMGNAQKAMLSVLSRKCCKLNKEYLTLPHVCWIDPEFRDVNMHTATE